MTRQLIVRRRLLRQWWILLLVLFLLAGSVVTGRAAEMVADDNEIYRLPAGQVIADDLYVGAQEVIIDGKVEGDLIVGAGYLEINGEVTQDVIAAAGGITINGVVGDDVRMTGAGLHVNGQIAGDLIMAGGGSSAPNVPAYSFNIGSRMIQQGVWLDQAATVGGDAYIAGGTGDLAGTVRGDLFTGMTSLRFAGRVNGDAHLYGSSVRIDPAARVEGTLTYSSEQAAALPEGIAAQIQQEPWQQAAPEPQPTVGERILTWSLATVRMLLGLLLLGALFLWLAPRFLKSLVATADQSPGMVALIGMVLALLMLPLTLVLIVVAWLFFDWFPGVLATAFFLFGLWGVLWFASPALSGLWLGRKLVRTAGGDWLALVVGILVFVLVAQAVSWLPVAGGLIGWLLWLASFVVATGALLRMARGGPAAAAPVEPVAGS